MGGFHPMGKEFNSTRYIRAIWGVDSETGRKVLLNLDNGEIIGEKDSFDKWINPEDKGENYNA